MPDTAVLRIREVRLLERPVRLRLPFRYGAVTLREAPQAFVRARVECGTRSASGCAAEMLAPKWFDKNPDLSDGENIDQLRRSLHRALPAYLDTAPACAFEHALAGREHASAATGAATPGSRRNGLVTGFGPALLDRAVLDALARLAGVSFADAVRANLPGIRLGDLAPDLADLDTGAFLATLAPRRSLQARHTVGLLDPLSDADRAGDGPGDGLPESLEQVVARYGNRWFKVKLGGDVDRDLARLRAVSGTLERICARGYGVTLDGNEQYTDAGALGAFLEALAGEPALARLRRAVAFLEQPIQRDAALGEDLGALRCPFPLVIDESDDGPDAFPAARERGYQGVSSKQCKGLYKSLANAARCAAWNGRDGGRRYFMTGEDLTCQGGVSVQQDLALAALLGVPHAERNGHHFAGPMPGAPPGEHRAFLRAHPGLYRAHEGRACLRIAGGRIALGSLDCTGFAHAADPDFGSMAPMPFPAGDGHGNGPDVR